MIYLWDDSSFRTLKRYPILPQVVEGLDYFSKAKRERKRWLFVRKIMRKSLEALDYLHRSSFCHNSLSSQTIWLTTTNQQEIDRLAIRLTELSVAQQFSELGPVGARKGVCEDFYQLAFIFLETIIASFVEDSSGAQIARMMLEDSADYSRQQSSLPASKDTISQLSHSELQAIFESPSICDSEFQAFREFVQSLDSWGTAVEMLEMGGGGAWKLLFTMMTRGRLFDDKRGRPITLSGNRLLRDFESMFRDTF